MSRRQVAMKLRIDLGTLRAWERAGLLPRFHRVIADVYADRVRLIVAARAHMSMQRIRAALAIGGC